MYILAKASLVDREVLLSGSQLLDELGIPGFVLTLMDEWAAVPIGVPVGVLDNIAGVAAPAIDQAYRYVLLTAGEGGGGEYNEGQFTGESVSGSAPLVIATAEVANAGSPLVGQTISLINTERRVLRAGLSGTVQADALQNITGTLSATANRAPFASGLGAFSLANSTGRAGPEGSGTNSQNVTFDASNVARTDTETRAKNIGVSYYMRIV